MGLYITNDDVKIRLLGKVKFTTVVTDENKMQESLLDRLVNEAEGEIEMRLSIRYQAPFQTVDGAPFSALPSRPTGEQLKTLCELEAVRRVLQTDFGRGSAAEGDKYALSVQEDLDKRLERLIEYRQGQFGQFKYPPLPGLMLADHNLADDGFAGRVLVTSAGYGDYPAGQINSPGETIFNGVVENI